MRGPKHSARKGKTPVLTAEEARQLLDSVDVTRKVTLHDGTEIEEPLLVGLRDRALIGLMVYTFARVGAALRMRVEDYYIQGRRDWVRLHEKGGKLHTLPCHDNLDRYLEEFVAAAGLAKDAKGPLFRTVRDRTAYLKNGGMLETAQQMTAHESPRTTGLYDRRSDDVSLDEVEKITI